jgi:hypothetical protein
MSVKLQIVIEPSGNECGSCRFLNHTDTEYGGGSGRHCSLFGESYLEVIKWGKWDGMGRPVGYRLKRLAKCVEAEVR